MGPYASESDLAALLERIIDCSADSLEDLYTIGSMIGEGRFSKVFSGVRACVPLLSPCEI